MALEDHSLLSTPGALTPFNRPVKSTRTPPRVRGHVAEGTATTYWEWSKSNAPKFARPGRRSVPKGKARLSLACCTTDENWVLENWGTVCFPEIYVHVRP